MKRYFLIILLLAVVISPVMGMIIEEPEETNTIIPKETILPKETPLPDYAPVQIETTYIEKTTIIERIISSISKVVGIEPPEPEPTDKETVTTVDIEVNIGGQVLATIPEGSKFNGIKVHTDCLKEGYGTDRWYSCEVFFQ